MAEYTWPHETSLRAGGPGIHPEKWEKYALTELSGKTLADLVGSVRKPLAKGYGHLFAEQAGEKDIFGGEGGWRFPLISNIRGRVQARRFEKGLRSGDIKTYGIEEPVAESYIDPLSLFKSEATGEYRQDESTRSKSDASMYLALGGKTYDVLKSLAHEGAHMEPIFGEQIAHGWSPFEGYVSMGQDVFEKYVENPVVDYWAELHSPIGQIYNREDREAGGSGLLKRPFGESIRKFNRRVDKANEMYDRLKSLQDAPGIAKRERLWWEN